MLGAGEIVSGDQSVVKIILYIKVASQIVQVESFVDAQRKYSISLKCDVMLCIQFVWSFLKNFD